MTRRIVALLVGVIVAVTLATAADEPPPGQTDAPPRLKKKKKADAGEVKADDKKPGEKKPDGKKKDERKDNKKNKDPPGPATKAGEPIDQDEDDKEVLERVARNMKAVEDRLVNKEINDGTLQ